MKDIVQGVVKFKAEAYPERKDLFAKLANSQSPSTLFITCSDSRIAPNLITQTEPGDIFVTRNAGNIVRPYNGEPGEVSTAIEYSIEALGVQHIVICGHSNCGAMKGALDVEAIRGAVPQVADWLTHSKAAVDAVKARCGCATAEQLDEVIEENVLLQIQHLKTHPSVVAKLATGAIQIHGWVYDIESGDIAVYDNRAEKFEQFETVYADEIAQA